MSDTLSISFGAMAPPLREQLSREQAQVQRSIARFAGARKIMRKIEQQIRAALNETEDEQ